MLDATDPFRPCTIDWCNGKGRWCARFWLSPGGICTRIQRLTRPGNAVPCPHFETADQSVFEAVERMRRDKKALVLFSGRTIAAMALWGMWQRPAKSTAGDALDYAARVGACPKCGWTCELCGGDGSNEEAECRVGGNCVVAEHHVCRCAPEMIRIEGPPSPSRIHLTRGSQPDPDHL